ncbi:ABC transporter permease [Halorubrum sp. BOL3-1]|uniref:ABC transporter permease n=1 Tax=Halorubrum sp. BOL3-1 TaxID=2497325 RepID=UPI0010051A5A|nr:ABC transporter permease [Halorubrum sp. BOL3-1]QAU13703.1 ABC transporter permease [Halorubrum sp. BOL3-1]
MATETGGSTEPAEQTSREYADRLLSHQRVESLLGNGLYAFAALMLVFLWLPLLIIVFLSFAQSPNLLPFEGFTLGNYRGITGEPGLRSSVVASFSIATLSAIIATVLGVLSSFALTRHQFPLREVYRTFGIIPMIVPGVILGVGLRFYFLTVGIDPSFFATVLTHSLYGLPFVLLIVSARLYTFDESLEEAARDLGADPLTTFRDVTFPVIAPAIGAGFLFAWVRSFEDYIRALFVSGITTDPLTQWMFGKITKASAENLNVLNAVSTLIVLAIAIALAVAMNYGNVTGYVAGTRDEEE